MRDRCRSNLFTHVDETGHLILGGIKRIPSSFSFELVYSNTRLNFFFHLCDLNLLATKRSERDIYQVGPVWAPSPLDLKQRTADWPATLEGMMIFRGRGEDERDRTFQTSILVQINTHNTIQSLSMFYVFFFSFQLHTNRYLTDQGRDQSQDRPPPPCSQSLLDE